MHQTNQSSVAMPRAGYFITSLRRSLCLALAALILTALIPTSALAASRESTAVPSQEASGPPLGAGESLYGAPAGAKPDPAGKVTPQKKDPHAKRVKEIIADRTENTKTYELSDGERQTVVAATPLHYKNAKGQFVDISTALVASEPANGAGTLQTLSTKVKTTFSANGSGAATLSQDGYSLSMSPVGAQLSAPLALGDTAIYLETGDDTSLSYQALDNGVKETLYLNKFKQKNFYDFKMDFTGLTFKQVDEAYQFLKADGSVAYILSDLLVTDSSSANEGDGAICPHASWELISSSKGSARFRATLDKDWLTSKDRVWPVKVDPSVADPTVINDFYIDSANTAPSSTVSNELHAGYYNSTIGFSRSFIPFTALPDLSGATFSKVTFNAYETAQSSTSAVTSYLGAATSPINAASSTAWWVQPAMAAVTSTNLTTPNSWITYDVTSALTDPLTKGSAFYGFVLYGDESSTAAANYGSFSSSRGSNSPYLTITYSTAVSPVSNLACASTPSANYFRETANSAGVITSKNDFPDAGRGSVSLSWKPDANADGYHVYAYDGAAYRQVGTTLGQDATSWSSAGAGIYPSDSAIASFGANGSYSGNPYVVGQSPSPATKVSSATLAWPDGTPFNATGSAGTGQVVSDGKYIYVKSWGTYPGSAKWVRFTQSNYPSDNPTYADPVIQATAETVPQSNCAFMFNGMLFDGAVTAATTNSTTIAAYDASAFTDDSAGNIGFTFNKPLLAVNAGTDIAAGTTGYGVMLTTDGTYIYSVGKNGQGFKVRSYDEKGNWIADWAVPASNTTAFSSLGNVTSDGFNLYLGEWTATNAARTYRVSLATHQVTDVWAQSDQATNGTVSYSYDFTSKRFVGGTISGGAIVNIYSDTGLDLRDDPSPLYRKQNTSYPTNINYWFRVAAFNAAGETAALSASCVQPTLEKRSVAIADGAIPDFTSLGSVAGLEVQGALNSPVVQMGTTVAALDTYGPAASVQRTYRSDMDATSAWLPKGWWFSFEQNLTTLSSGVVRYIDSAGQPYLFTPESSGSSTYLSPAGMFSTLTKTSTGWTLTDSDLTQHTFDSSGAITADIDRLGNKVIYSGLGTSQVTITANYESICVEVIGANSFLLMRLAGQWYNEAQYDISGNTLTVTENNSSAYQIKDKFTQDSSGRLTAISRGADSAQITYETNSLSFAHTASSVPPAPVTIAYSARSANVGQAVVSKGSGTALGSYSAGTEQALYLTDPSGLTLFSSTSADNVYGAATTYNAYNQVISTRSPVTPDAAGIVFSDSTTDPVAASLIDYDSGGRITYQKSAGDLETFNYYNTAGDLIKTIDNSRAVTWYDVDANGQILVTEKLLETTGKRARSEYTYNAQGLMTSEKDAISQNTDGSYLFDEKDYSNFHSVNGRPQKTVEKQVQLSPGASLQDITTSCSINDNGDTTSVTDGRGITTTTNTYDALGLSLLLTSTDKAGVVTNNIYDIFGHQTETYQSSGAITGKNNWAKTTYDASGNVTSTSTLSSDGTAVETTQKALDVLGREVSSDSSAQPGAQTTAYDNAGNAVSSTSEGTVAGTTTTTQYDQSGQAIQTANSLTPGAPTATTYDAAGNVTSTTTPGQPDQTTDYDVAGNATTQTNGQVTTNSDYDLNNNVVASTQTAPSKPAVKTTSTYDLKGELLSTKMADQTATTNTYNVRGDLLSTTGFDGITTTYSYDAAGNQLTEKVGSDNPTTKTYDNASRVTEQVNPDGTKVDYIYDGLSRVIEQKEYQGSTLVKDTTTVYDSAGRLSSTADSVSGYKQTYSYQNTGSGTSAQTVTTKTETLPDGDTQTTVVNGSVFGSATLNESSATYKVTNTAFDAGGRPTTITQSGTFSNNPTYGSPQTNALSYDSQGHLVSDSNLSATGQATYAYGSDSKLVSTSFSKLGQSASYAYSADRTQLSSATINSATSNYTYNATTGDITAAGANGFTYDSAGRLATRTGTAATYSYDQMGRRTSGAGATNTWSGQRLTSATNAAGTVSYSYDGEGQRLSKTLGPTKTTYVYDGIKLMQVTQKGANQQLFTYLYGQNSTPVGGAYDVSVGSGSSAVGYSDVCQIVSDARGDVLELRDVSGATFARYSYDAYGTITSSQVFATSSVPLAVAQAVSDLQPLRYAGYAWDSETGLYYCSQRYYDPSTASFISRDPAKADGEKSPYMYCAGEPVGGVDPSGMSYYVSSLSFTCGLTGATRTYYGTNIYISFCAYTIPATWNNKTIYKNFTITLQRKKNGSYSKVGSSSTFTASGKGGSVYRKWPNVGSGSYRFVFWQTETYTQIIGHSVCMFN